MEVFPGNLWGPESRNDGPSKFRCRPGPSKHEFILCGSARRPDGSTGAVLKLPDTVCEPFLHCTTLIVAAGVDRLRTDRRVAAEDAWTDGSWVLPGCRPTPEH